MELTAVGEAELAEQHRRADAVVEDLLRALTDGQRGELIEAITTAERLLRLGSVTVEVADPASAAARQCLEAYVAEIRVRFPEGFAAADLVRPGEVDGQTGVLLVAYEADHPIGCVALRRLEAGVGEVRHLWVHTESRGLGLGRRLMSEVERHAMDRDITTVRLGTHEVLTEAITLYQAIGYAQIPPYGETAHAHFWFEKHLPTED